MKICLKNDQIVYAESDVRLDLAGGYSDTPPATTRYGGKVINCSIKLGNRSPVHVYVSRFEEAAIQIYSIDRPRTPAVYRDFSELSDFGNPRAEHALVKAALHLVGINPDKSGRGRLEACLKDMGGGLRIQTFVAVPSGSGLGTSSILGGAVLGSIHYALGNRLGQDITQSQLLNEVLVLEQMMGTGGGWQDQVGGLLGGLKFTENKPAGNLKLDLSVRYLDDSLFHDPQNAPLITLFYTGACRLAHDVLSQVVARVESEDPEYLVIHQKLVEGAEQMADAISRRDLVGVAGLLNAYWELKKGLHLSVTNERIERMLEKVRPYYRGACLMGAGGGGFCLFVSDSTRDSNNLRRNLSSWITGLDDNSRVVDFSLSNTGLVVTAT